MQKDILQTEEFTKLDLKLKYQNKIYKDFPSWENFQPFFPKEYQLNEANLPEEEHIRMGKFNIHLDRYIPSEKSEIKVLLLHGGGGNGRLFSPVGVGLREKGIECFAPDLPGFGLSEYSKKVDYKDWIQIVSDLIDLEFQIDGKPIYIFGMSLGGMLAYQVASVNKHVKGIAVTALADTTTKEVRLKLSRDYFSGTYGAKILNKFSSLLDGIKVPIKETTNMWAMANNQDFVKLLKKDKVGSGSWVHLKFLRTLMNTKSMPAENFTQCPVLFLQPENDKIMPFELSENFYNKLKVEKEYVQLDNCGHIPLETPGIHQLKDSFFKFITENNKK